MQLSLTTKNIQGYNCLENLIIPISTYWDRNHELMFLESWDFIYRKSTELGKIGTIEYNDPSKALSYLQQYHGIGFCQHEMDTPENAYKIIKQELSDKRPVIIHMDSYWCNWFTPNYQKIHSSHFCLVTGFDSINKDLFVIDSQFATSGTTLTYDHFCKGLGFVLSIQIMDNQQSDYDWKKLIMNSLEKLMDPLRSANAFVDIREYAKDVKHVNFENEIANFHHNPFKAPVFNCLIRIKEYRYQYAIALNYLAKKYNVDSILQFANRMKSIGDNWSSIFGLLCKAYYLHNDCRLLERLSNKISNLADVEEKLYNDLLTSCRVKEEVTHHTIQSTMQHHNMVITEFTYIDVQSHFNNKGFGSTLDYHCKAELSNEGKYYYMEGLPKDDIWQVENMSFQVSMHKDLPYDNISCMGQVINIFKTPCDCIMFLGCSELGNHSEYIMIEFSDLSKEKIPLQLTNWAHKDSNYNDIIAWTGKGVSRSLDRIIIYPFPTFLHADCYAIKTKKAIKALYLPYCPNLHIFSITLGNK